MDGWMERDVNFVLFSLSHHPCSPCFNLIDFDITLLD
jgi:hypothetical protein